MFGLCYLAGTEGGVSGVLAAGSWAIDLSFPVGKLVFGLVVVVVAL